MITYFNDVHETLFGLLNKTSLQKHATVLLLCSIKIQNFGKQYKPWKVKMLLKKSCRKSQGGEDIFSILQTRSN